MSTTRTHPEAASARGGRLDANWKTLLASSTLPAPIVAVISTVVSRARLWKRERADVTRELIAHFRDGLERGESADDLIRAFGDPRQAGARIGVAARAKRHWTWHAWRRGAQTVAAGLAVAVVGYGALAVRFAMGTPTIARNYLQELNAPVLRVPEDERAWTEYRAVLIGTADAPGLLTRLNREDLPAEVFDVTLARPGQPRHPQWDRAAAWITSIAPDLDRIRQASHRPTMGYVLTTVSDPLLSRAASAQPATGPAQPPEVQPENPALIGTLIEPLGHIRTFVRYLRIDALVAADAGDGARAVENLRTVLRLARQADSMDFLIVDMFALALADLTWRTAAEILEMRPDAISDADLATLAAEIAVDTGAREFKPDLRGETPGFEDTLQRVFTDDGTGDGRLTPEGLVLLHRLASAPLDIDQPVSTATSLGVHAVGPVALALTASRKETRARWEQIMAEIEAIQAAPMWEWTEHPSAPTDRFSDADKERYPVLAVLLPAVGTAVERGVFANQQRDAALVAVALERFRRATGAYPTTLDALVPTYLSNVPRDIMDGEPLRYRLTDQGPIVYSVGMDRVDNDGRQARDADGKPVTRQPWISVAEARTRHEAGGFASQLVYDGDMVLFPQPK
jgi:hypothetical protein